MLLIIKRAIAHIHCSVVQKTYERYWKIRNTRSAPIVYIKSKKYYLLSCLLGTFALLKSVYKHLRMQIRLTLQLLSSYLEVYVINNV